MTNCHLYFEALTEPYSLNLYRVTFSLDVDNERHSIDAGSGAQISSMDSIHSLTFQGYNSQTDELSFTLTDKQAQTTHNFHFGVKYWPSFCDYNNMGHSSGIYAFRPIDKLFEPLKYSNIKDMKVYPDAQLVQKFFFTF
jgi:hypothetical protein